MDTERFRAFARGTFQRGSFLRRLNRFVVEAALGGETVRAHLPNPGRLWEILFPGAELALLPTPNSPKLAWKVAAARRDGRWVNLDTIRTNALARFLIERGRVLGLEGWRVVSSEVPHGNSRFDFLLGNGSRRLFLEVKSCTLFQGPMSMFPDAVTERGRRHLVELASMPEAGERGAVLIVSQGPESRFFLPDYHTDPAFARAFIDLRGRFDVFPVSVGWEEDLFLGPVVRPLEIPWDILENTDMDAGAWLALIENAPCRGEPPFAVRAGVEKAGLDRRMKRLAKDFPDQLVKVLPVRGYTGGLDRVEKALSRLSSFVEPVSAPLEGRFFRFSGYPLANPEFVKFLLEFRMILQPLGKML